MVGGTPTLRSVLPGTGVPANHDGFAVTESHPPVAAADVRPARVRALAVIAYVAVILRLMQLVPWPLTMAAYAGQGLADTGLAVAVYATLGAWSLFWVGLTLVRRTIPVRLVPVDVVLVAVGLVLGGFATNPEDATSWANPAAALALGVVLASAGAASAAGSAIAVAVVAAAYLGGVVPGLEQGWASAAIALGTLVGVGTLGVVVGRHLLRQADVADAAAVELAAARARTAAEESRQRERGRQYRMLHDTVLSTLSALARGGLDIDDPLVRQRIAADADYLRGLISSDGVSSGNQLQGELAAIGRSQAALGLRVHVHCADIRVDLPMPVVQAVSDATREALNNVIKHSGVDQAWVTAFGPPANDPAHPQLTVTITDRGHGFDPATGHRGIGLRDSITGRMSEVGGAVVIDSSPGQGTTVELTWPA